MNSLRCCLVLVCLLGSGVNVRAQDDTLPVRDRVWILSKTYQAISVYFAHWETAAYGPAQADSVYEASLSRAVAPWSRVEFTRLMQEYLALLRNGHCNYTDFLEYQSSIPLGFDWMFRPADADWVVTKSNVAGLVLNPESWSVSDESFLVY